MKKLATEFEGRGEQKNWKFFQLARVGKIAIFRKETGGFAGFEVIKIREQPERNFAGKIVPAHESFPSPETWGTDGWTFTSLEDAKKKFEPLTGMPFSTYPKSKTEVFNVSEGQHSGDGG